MFMEWCKECIYYNIISTISLDGDFRHFVTRCSKNIENKILCTSMDYITANSQLVRDHETLNNQLARDYETLRAWADSPAMRRR